VTADFVPRCALRRERESLQQLLLSCFVRARSCSALRCDPAGPGLELCRRRRRTARVVLVERNSRRPALGSAGSSFGVPCSPTKSGSPLPGHDTKGNQRLCVISLPTRLPTCDVLGFIVEEVVVSCLGNRSPPQRGPAARRFCRASCRAAEQERCAVGQPLQLRFQQLQEGLRMLLKNARHVNIVG